MLINLGKRCAQVTYQTFTLQGVETPVDRVENNSDAKNLVTIMVMLKSYRNVFKFRRRELF